MQYPRRSVRGDNAADIHGVLMQRVRVQVRGQGPRHDDAVVVRFVAVPMKMGQAWNVRSLSGASHHRTGSACPITWHGMTRCHGGAPRAVSHTCPKAPR